MNITCILMPNFALKCEQLKNPQMAAANTVIAGGTGSRKCVFNHAPDLRGLENGMPLEQALGLYGDIDVLDADLALYHSLFNTILDRLQAKTPLLEGAGPGTVYTCMQGMQLIYPDEEAFINALKEAIPPVFEARFGIAGGKFPALLAASVSPPGQFKSLAGNSSSFIQNMPCSCLPVSPKIKARLAAFGLKTLGQLARLEPGALGSQFGPEGRRIWELANGQDSETLNPRPSREIIEESMELDPVTISLDILLLCLEGMLNRALATLLPRGMGIICADIWTRTTNGQHCRKSIHFKQAATGTRAALARIKSVLEACPQPGPVEELGMMATASSCLSGRQKSLLPEIRSKDNFLSEMRQLEFKLGSPKVFKFKEVEPWSRIPERRHVLSPLNG